MRFLSLRALRHGCGARWQSSTASVERFTPGPRRKELAQVAIDVRQHADIVKKTSEDDLVAISRSMAKSGSEIELRQLIRSLREGEVSVPGELYLNRIRSAWRRGPEAVALALREVAAEGTTDFSRAKQVAIDALCKFRIKHNSQNELKDKEELVRQCTALLYVELSILENIPSNLNLNTDRKVNAENEKRSQRQALLQKIRSTADPAEVISLCEFYLRTNSELTAEPIRAMHDAYLAIGRTRKAAAVLENALHNGAKLPAKECYFVLSKFLGEGQLENFNSTLQQLTESRASDRLVIRCLRLRMCVYKRDLEQALKQMDEIAEFPLETLSHKEDLSSLGDILADTCGDLLLGHLHSKKTFDAQKIQKCFSHLGELPLTEQYASALITLGLPGVPADKLEKMISDSPRVSVAVVERNLRRSKAKTENVEKLLKPLFEGMALHDKSCRRIFNCLLELGRVDDAYHLLKSVKDVDIEMFKEILQKKTFAPTEFIDSMRSKDVLPDAEIFRVLLDRTFADDSLAPVMKILDRAPPQAHKELLSDDLTVPKLMSALRVKEPLFTRMVETCKASGGDIPVTNTIIKAFLDEGSEFHARDFVERLGIEESCALLVEHDPRYIDDLHERAKQPSPVAFQAAICGSLKLENPVDFVERLLRTMEERSPNLYTRTFLATARMKVRKHNSDDGMNGSPRAEVMDVLARRIKEKKCLE
uniref:Pentacotripeptide-repeat region of PRORP domain-containing protein n=1 Tax=Rhodosorus marinus TaxID=101924 RepID=A0A7S3A4Y5_9RHOD|mmetsp:Transcript_43898/g.171567  ORF Transcript_43898/g.171567 Transcript_43898/m.171567 type:complete len:707 (+) Transcript_43898:200-2320(+)